jgi:hypothetical protein
MPSSLGADSKELLPALVSGHATTAMVAVKRRSLQQLLPYHLVVVANLYLGIISVLPVIS